MDAQRARARSASQFGAAQGGDLQLDVATAFTGYEHLDGEASVVALVHDGAQVEALSAGQDGQVVLDATPFYAESGGQVGDRGVIESESAMFAVHDTQKQGGSAFAHVGILERGQLKVGDRVRPMVDVQRRQATVLNHSGTHLLHAALRTVLGDHVQQKGSLVGPERLRFDFSHYEPLTPEQLETIESMVNAQIRANAQAQTRLMSMDDAVQSGAMALFGEKYGDEVRVLSIGEFSVELCGGTHVAHAGDIGLFKITAETGIASGVRRIEAVTGDGALQWVRDSEHRLANIAGLLKGSREDAGERVAALVDKTRALEKELEQLKNKMASSQGSDLAGQAVEIDGVQVLAARMDGADSRVLRDTLDQLKNKLGSAAVVLATVDGDKISLVAGVTKDQTARLKAGELVNAVATQVGGKGGGRPDMAQAGGNNPAALDAALASVEDWVRKQIG
jgi:alanyl-tRNA synthetase